MILSIAPFLKEREIQIREIFSIVLAPNSTCDEFISLQVSIDEQGRSCDPIYLYAQKQHIFAEGPDFLLSDVVLYPQFYLGPNHLLL